MGWHLRPPHKIPRTRSVKVVGSLALEQRHDFYTCTEASPFVSVHTKAARSGFCVRTRTGVALTDMRRSRISSGGGQSTTEGSALSSPNADVTTRMSRLLRECERLLDARKYDDAARLLSAIANEYDVTIQLSLDLGGHRLEAV